MRTKLLALLQGCFARVEPWLQAGKYVTAVASGIAKRNGRPIAEHAGIARRVRPSGCLTAPPGTPSPR
jgi:hypothetical protein